MPTNVAEGCGRGSESELRRFIAIATGSASELEYQLLLAHDLGYLNEEQHTTLSNETIEIRRTLLAYAKTLKEA